MRWEGEFRVPGAPEDVVLEFADARRMARHMPGAEITGEEEDGTLTGTLTVSFGPKRLVFKGKARCEADVAGLNGRIIGQGASDMRAARFKVELSWKLAPDTAAHAPATVVSLISEAALQGVLADFARTGGPVVAGLMTEEFATRLRRDLEARQAGDVYLPDENSGDHISAGRIAGAVAKNAAKRAGQSITGLFRRGGKNE